MQLPVISRKRIAVAIFLLGVGIGAANAILPAFMATWLITGTNMLVADISVGTVGALAGFLWWDCNGFSLTSQCKSTTQTSINANSVGNVFANKPMQVDLRPQGTRGNPDPTKWDSATGTSRNPTPKSLFSIYAGLPVMPSTYPAVVQDIGGAGTKSYYSASGSNYSRRDEQSSATAIAGKTAAWSGAVTLNGVTSTWYVYDTVSSLACPVGYTMNSGTCTLTDAGSVTKPITTTCEVLYDSGTQTFNFDVQNSNCAGLSSQILQNLGRKISTVDSGSGEKISAETLANGGFAITQYKPDGTWVQATTGPYSEVNGGYPIASTTSGDSSQTPGTGSGTGTGGTGTSGTGSGSGGSCGGVGQVPCAIDDSGLAGKTVDINPPLQGVQSAHDDMLSAMQSHMPSAPSWSWALPVQPVACQPVSLNVLGRPWVIDWCPYIPLMQQAISFLAYCFTALHLFSVVTRPAKRA